MKKKGIAMILSVALLSMSTYVAAFASEDTLNEDITMCYQSPITTYSSFSVGEPVDESLMPRARAATINVNITSPCDSEFRNRYSDWAYQANRAVERADDGLYRLYGIDYLSVAQVNWSSSGSTMEALLINARNQHGLTYNGNQTADIMVAFTGKTVDSSVLGIAYVGAAYSLIKDGGYDQNAACTQHETGHTYGCSHDGSQWDNDSACVMYRYLRTGNIDSFCSSHNSVMNSNKNRY